MQIFMDMEMPRCIDTNARIQGYQNAKMLGYKYKKIPYTNVAKIHMETKCKDFWMQMQRS
jgi:hypothetical protein